MMKSEIAREIYKAAHITGEFTLRSGQTSNEYFDKYLFEAEPALLTEIARLMKDLIPEGIEVLAGLEMGGIPVVTALSIESQIPAAFVRKKAKPYATRKLAEGADIIGKRICIVEDVVTTGGQIIESAKELRSCGALVDSVLCVVQRGENAAELLSKEGLRLIPAFTMEYIKQQL